MSNAFMDTNPKRLTDTRKTPPRTHRDPDELKLSLDLHLNQERMRTDKKKNIKRSDNGVKE